MNIEDTTTHPVHGRMDKKTIFFTPDLRNVVPKGLANARTERRKRLIPCHNAGM